MNARTANQTPRQPRPEAPKNLVGLTLEEITAEVCSLGEKPFRIHQLRHWIYHRGATGFDEMTTLSKAFRQRLIQGYTLERPAVTNARTSSDGTRKWLLRFTGGAEAETVYIPEDDRGTLCISSQVGCTLACRFCHTGTQPFVRNLTTAEIVAQLFVARDALSDWPSSKEDRAITNIVFMGMGEPLHNIGNVGRALAIFTDGDGIAISKRRVTVSTAGVAPAIRRLGAEHGVKLAVSLHATTDEVRDKLIPLNRKYPIAKLLDACRGYPGAKNARRITFEYILLKGVNDSPKNAQELVKLLAGMPVKVNLIPFNPWPGAPFECPDEETIKCFAQVLAKARLAAPVRSPRGRDIEAACGQLKTATERARRDRVGPAGEFGDESAGKSAGEAA
jgi:23S rRNA (adenine2503-C2)-methyltransferase